MLIYGLGNKFDKRILVRCFNLFIIRGPLPFYKVIKWGLIWTKMKRVPFLTGSTTMKRDGSLMKCSLVRKSIAHGIIIGFSHCSSLGPHQLEFGITLKTFPHDYDYPECVQIPGLLI